MAGTRSQTEAQPTLVCESELISGASVLNSIEGIDIESLADGATCYARLEGLSFRWFQDSVAAPSPGTVILPVQLTAGDPGRWLLIASGGGGGAVDTVAGTAGVSVAPATGNVVVSGVALYARDGSNGPMTAVVNFGGFAGQNLANPALAQDAATKFYVDAGDAATLASANAYADAGDAATLASANTYANAGDAATLASANAYTDAAVAAVPVPPLANVLVAGNSAGAKIINLTDPTAAQDAATKNYVDTRPAPPADTLTAVLTAGNDGGALQIKNIADPTLAQDAATKAYVDAAGSAPSVGLNKLNQSNGAGGWLDTSFTIASGDEIHTPADVSFVHTTPGTFLIDGVGTFSVVHPVAGASLVLDATTASSKSPGRILSWNGTQNVYISPSLVAAGTGFSFTVANRADLIAAAASFAAGVITLQAASYLVVGNIALGVGERIAMPNGSWLTGGGGLQQYTISANIASPAVTMNGGTEVKFLTINNVSGAAFAITNNVAGQNAFVEYCHIIANSNGVVASGVGTKFVVNCKFSVTNDGVITTGAAVIANIVLRYNYYAAAQRMIAIAGGTTVARLRMESQLCDFALGSSAVDVLAGGVLSYCEIQNNTLWSAGVVINNAGTVTGGRINDNSFITGNEFTCFNGIVRNIPGAAPVASAIVLRNNLWRNPGGTSFKLLNESPIQVNAPPA